MAPLLIDSRDYLKFVFISVLVTVLVFASGIFVGIQRAEAFYQAGSVIQPLMLPEQVVVVEDIADSQSPDSIVAGEYIDVDQPDTMLETSPQTLAGASKVKIIPNSNDNDNTTPYEKVVTEQRQEVKQLDTAQARPLTAEELNNIKYSIQVGMYGRFINADNMMKLLQAKNYQAYITDYTNQKNETRYNVRFGYFSDKGSAVSSLEGFKSDQNGDGYLVRFSADNIVNIARAAEDRQTVTVPEHSENSGNDLSPAADPSEITPDKISQADVLKDGLTKTN